MAVDQGTKAWANATLPAGKTVTVITGWAWFRLTQNTGVTLGLFGGHSELVGILSLVVVTGLALLAVGRGAGGLPSSLAVGAVVGGALSNVVDRVRRGSVTDFIEIHRWPTDFNLADAAIRLGVVVFLLSLLVEAIRRRPVAPRG